MKNLALLVMLTLAIGNVCAAEKSPRPVGAHAVDAAGLEASATPDDDPAGFECRRVSNREKLVLAAAER